MKKTIVSLYGVLVFLLATATFAEPFLGTDFVAKHLYHSYWFCGLWGLLALGMTVVFFRRKFKYRWPILLLHFSFLVILLGGLATFLTSRKGYIHLLKDSPTATYIRSDGQKACALPFTLVLDSFQIVYYPGTPAPQDYESHLRLYPLNTDSTDSRPITVSMNRIFTEEGYRFYQSSFDEDRQGSWLRVNYDPWGTPISYAGYLLLGLSMLWLLLDRQSTFRSLLRHPLLKRGAALFLFGIAGNGLGAQPSGLTDERNYPAGGYTAEQQVIYQGRITPFNTLARDFVQKIAHTTSYHGLSPEEVLNGWIQEPERWEKEPMIYIKSTALQQQLHLPTPYARLADLYDSRQGLFLLSENTADCSSVGVMAIDKTLEEVYEKVGLLLMLGNGTYVKPLPTDGSVAPLSKTRVQAELLYNAIPFSKLLFMGNLTVGLLAFWHLLYKVLHKKQSLATVSTTPLDRLWIVFLYAATLFHLFGYALRGYIAGRLPLSNGYETMQFVALCALVLSCLIRRRFSFTLPFGLLLSGFALLVSYLGQMNPQITPLMPVLISPWLSAHVSLIMMSYALFAFLLFNGVLAFCLPHEAERLQVVSKLLLYPATFFLGAGIFLGAVWANVSWGSYWTWDPKEVWALITFMVYGAAFHEGSLRAFKRPAFFHLYMILAFLTVLMTYFGVNYVLGGMHSYANG